MVLQRWWCGIKTIIRSLRIGYPINSPFPMIGHTFVELEKHDNVYVLIAECEICGKTDISWSEEPLP